MGPKGATLIMTDTYSATSGGAPNTAASCAQLGHDVDVCSITGNDTTRGCAIKELTRMASGVTISELRTKPTLAYHASCHYRRAIAQDITTANIPQSQNMSGDAALDSKRLRNICAAKNIVLLTPSNPRKKWYEKRILAISKMGD